jgi:hypothetical protein
MLTTPIQFATATAAAVVMFVVRVYYTKGYIDGYQAYAEEQRKHLNMSRRVGTVKNTMN